MPSTPTRPVSATQRLVAGVLAVLLPAVVLAVGISWLLAPRSDELSEAAARMEQAVAEADPEVVVVGNSLVARGIEPEPLAAGLADEPVRVAKVWESGTWPANWYLFLKNRVYGQGIEPHAVVIGMAPKVLFQTELGSELSQKSLGDHVGDYEPVVYGKVFGRETPNPFLQRLREQRGAFQERWAGWLRAGSVGLFRGDPGLPLLERGEAEAAPALERVFEEGAVDMSLHQRVIPVVEHEEEVRLATDSSVVAASFVPDLLDLAEAHGSKVVFVRMPMHPATEASMAVDPAVMAEFIRLLNERGAAFVDMAGLDLPRTMFDDPAHLSRKGRAHFTPLLAAALRERGIMDDGPFAPNRVPLALTPRVGLEGVIPDLGPLSLEPDPKGETCRFQAVVRDHSALSQSALAAAGLSGSPLVVFEDGQPLEMLTWPGKLAGACHGAYVPQSANLFVSPGPHAAPPREQRRYTLGLAAQMPVRVGNFEGWFVYPGTTLAFDFDGWQGPAEDLEVLVGLEPLIGEAAGVQVTVAGQAVPLAPRGQRWIGGSLGLASPDGPWRITISAPEAGPYLAVRWLAVRARGETLDLAGSASQMEPPMVSFLASPGQSEARAQGGPAPRTPPLVASSGEGAARVELPDLDFLRSRSIGAHMSCGRCSPLRVFEDDTELPRPEPSCGAVRRGTPGSTCHPQGAMEFTSTDGSDPLTNGRRYRVVWNPDRQQGRGWWVYPGDVAALPVPPSQLRLLRDGASRLHLEGTPLPAGDEDGQLHLRLSVGEREIFAEDIPVRSFADGPFDRTLAERYDLRGSVVTLELRSDPDAPYLFLHRLELGE